jgi:hypothetical protein
LLDFRAKSPSKIVGQTSIKEKKRGIFLKNGAHLHGGSSMRLAYPEMRLDCLPIGEVKLNLDCRDEIIPILRALQHLYEDAELRRKLLSLVGKDVNGTSDELLGDRGAGGSAARLQLGL